jgi:hypothetical protein
MFSGSSNCDSVFFGRWHGVERDGKHNQRRAAPTAFQVSAARRQKCPWPPLVGDQASSEARNDGRSPRSMQRLAWYRPRHKNGPMSKKPALSAITYAGAVLNTAPKRVPHDKKG